MLKFLASLLIVLLLVVLPSTLAQPTESPSTDAASAHRRSYEEHNFYYNGEKWVPDWFQCDQTDKVVVLLNPSESATQSLLTFSKGGSQVTRTVALRRREPDCGMMKCWWSFKAKDQARVVFAIQESHYYDAEAFWTFRHWLGVARNQDAANARMRSCRWFPRLRIAAITDQRSIYVTENARGALLLRTFDYGGNPTPPSLLLAEGVVTLDQKSRVETYTFEGKAYRYVIAVSLANNNPNIDVWMTKQGEAIRKEDCLSYTYVKKL